MDHRDFPPASSVTPAVASVDQFLALAWGEQSPTSNSIHAQ
jgi:hypothetical protein